MFLNMVRFPGQLSRCRMTLGHGCSYIHWDPAPCLVASECSDHFSLWMCESWGLSYGHPVSCVQWPSRPIPSLLPKVALHPSLATQKMTLGAGLEADGPCLLCVGQQGRRKGGWCGVRTILKQWESVRILEHWPDTCSWPLYVWGESECGGGCHSVAYYQYIPVSPWDKKAQHV